MKRFHYLLLICLVALSPVTYAGWNIPVTNFSVADYSAGTQNWQLLTTRNGWVFSDAELKGWMREAGFEPGETRPAPPPMPHWLVSAVRP